MLKNKNKYDKLFMNILPASISGLHIFGIDDNYIKPQKYNDVTNLENRLWENLFINVVPLINQYVCKEYLLGMRTLPIPTDRFPEFDAISPLIENSTDWQLVPVSGFLTEGLFFDLSANRKFPVTDIIRKSPRFEKKYAEKNIQNEEGYTPEPDIFHDIQGHVPLLMNKSYANFMHDVGILGDKILKNKRKLSRELISHNLTRLQNFAWWTYEFGLIKCNRETNQFRRQPNDIEYEIYGSGIISSYDETLNVIACAKKESKHSTIYPYNIEEIVMTCFNYSDIQDRYYAVESMDELYSSFKNNQDLFWFEG